MSVAIYRVTVRGRFDGLDDDSRARLLAAADEHDALQARFAPGGTLTYDKRLDFFSYRIETRVQHDDDGEDAVTAVAFEQALLVATEDLQRRGVGHRDLSVKGSNMASVWR